MSLPRVLAGSAVALFAAVLAAGCGSSSSHSSNPNHQDAGDSGGGTGGVDGSSGSGGADAAAGSDAGADSDAGCPAGMQSCGGQCVSATDPAYGCGDGSCQPCALANATATCANGACAVDTCDAGYADCNADPSDGCEAELDTDPNNCGSCGTACAAQHVATPACVSGQCAVGTCDTGYTDCNNDFTDGCEANTDGDPTNCGTCGTVCPATGGAAVCNSGSCDISKCPAGTGECDGDPKTVCETNLRTDPANCGYCGNACSLPNAGSTCSTGQCVVTACNSGFDNCDGKDGNGCEVNLGTDVNNCGACGKACTNANGTTTCVASACVPSCSSGYGDCDGDTSNGCETNTDTDPANCGGCGNACSANNGTPSCVSGACKIACDPGWGDCDGDPTNGCETQLDTNTNCGGCGKSCSPANGTGSCASGNCSVVSCTSGYADCDGKSSNGCEVNIGTDPTHCGSCTTACSTSGGTATCSSGTCGITCGAGFGDCDNNVANGCETSLDTTSNCGGCGKTCSNPNGTTTCTSGQCAPSCSAGFDDCDGNPANGCETNLNQSTNNCSACGNVCSCPNGTPNCVNGSCGCSSCSAGTADCDGKSNNGCETNTQTDPNNCGACGTVCSSANGTASCSGGSCSIVCNPGWDNCDGNAQSNGCETQLNTLTDCGSCGTPCSRTNATATCSTGSCKISSCNSGYGNCDGNDANGCETNTQTSTNDCGACGTVCSGAHGTPSCSGGSCSIVCTSGYGNCDGNAQSNGCETQLNTNADCGGCGVPCSLPNATTSCSTGSCQFVSCSSGYGDCNNNTADGCEASLSTTTNCGSCGTACTNQHGTTQCSSGACAPSCNSGWGDCNSNKNDGCETSLTTLTDCGSCGTACSLANATASCSTGSCAVSSCDPGWANCDAKAANGCETNTQTDTNNCGACGTLCSNNNGTPSCSLGACSIVCSAGWGNCDGDARTNGCETDLTTSQNNCGSCGHACSASQTCVNGTCKNTAAVCGNGVIEAGEQCDDGNTLNLDGCSSTCKYEEIQRVTQLSIMRTTTSPSYCTPTTNQFGKALTSSAANSFNSSLQSDIDAGNLNTMLDFLGLDDLTGVNDSSLTVGVVNGTLDPKKGTWNPPGAIDWWFLANAADIDSSGIPIYQLSPAAIASNILTGGPSTVVLDYGGSPLTMLDSNLMAQTGTTTSVPAPPPSALAAGLTTFETLAANTAGQGLCGNITVGSLAAIPAPQDITTSSTNSTHICRSTCIGSLSYTYCGAGNPVGPTCNSLLDVIVGGCRAALCTRVVNATQPDVGVGGNPPNTLTNSGAYNKVSVSQPNDAYSSYFQFTAQRAHITNNLP